MNKTRPYVMSIAGFDPSGGAGILADIKTFEVCGAYGFGVCSAVTYQNDISFEKVEWLSKEQIIQQVTVLKERFRPSFIKVGLIKSFNDLKQILVWLKEELPESKIIWDPILKASAGYQFHSLKEIADLEDVLNLVYLVTPNLPEAGLMGQSDSPVENARWMSQYCAVYLKGGHLESGKVTDLLFEADESKKYQSERISNGEKHGSGCVLSSAITSYLSLGNDLKTACRLAKTYVEKFLGSNPSLLGYHSVDKSKSQFEHVDQ